jgi:hypothetical protein
MPLRSPRSNTAFQELFSLPADEFLISSFTCYLKRKLPTQVLLKLRPTLSYIGRLDGDGDIGKGSHNMDWDDIVSRR